MRGNSCARQQASANRTASNNCLIGGADINAQGNGESTALHQAARIQDLELCKFLIANGADVNARDQRGQTPLFELFDRWAIYPENIPLAKKQQAAFPVLQLLLEHGADVNAKANSTTSTSRASAMRWCAEVSSHPDLLF